jgi:prolyl oligopeptidase PreP (S9A serine peptidase family)
MKKVLCCLAICVCFASLVTAQEEAESSENENVSVAYVWLTNEARFTFTAPSADFDRGDAVSAIRDRILEFMSSDVKVNDKGKISEDGEYPKYYYYRYTKPDTTQSNRENQTIYTSYVLFLS